MFKLHRKGSAATEAIEYIVGTANEAISLGEVLKLSSGKLTKASGTDTPEFVSLGSGTGVVIPVKRIYEDEEYETVQSAAFTNITIGSKVTINSDGLKVTATTTNGVFYVTGIDGTSVGDKVRGYFRR